MPGYLRIEQVRSTIGRTADQRATVRSLGLRRIRHVVVRPDRPEVRGMLRKVPHLVSFEEVDAPAAATATEAPAKGAPAKEAPAKKAPAKKAPAKKAPAKKAATERASAGGDA
jgi:large subunit ribosomal protein L30